MDPSSSTLRVAVIGAGPAGFYAAESLLKQHDNASVDVFDRLPTPFGLVRAGVAPDHQKIKNVTRVYTKTAARPGFRFFGNVTFGEDISLDQLRHHYHAVVLTTGAQEDRSLGIPGEELPRSHSATEFVAWYNGHPDFRHLSFDLSQRAAVIVGVGNVAVDVARILCRTHEELAATDIADYALEALAKSNIEDVYVLGRRGPAQAAFTNPEAKELGELPGADLLIRPDEARLDAISQSAVDEDGDRTTLRKVEMIETFAGRAPEGRPKRLHLRFLVSPTRIEAAEDGGVGAVDIVHNEIYRTDRGGLRPRATDRQERLEAGLVFRSVGYRGSALPGVPFRDDWGTIPNVDGRVTNSEGQVIPGVYTAGWIKRGPSGVIGTNKACAVETVGKLLEDAAAGQVWAPSSPDPASSLATALESSSRVFNFDDWLALDKLEMAAGEAGNRPRVKFTTIEEMVAALA